MGAFLPYCTLAGGACGPPSPGLITPSKFSSAIVREADPENEIMKLCNNMDDFRHNFAKVLQKSALQMRFDDINWGMSA